MRCWRFVRDTYGEGGSCGGRAQTVARDLHTKPAHQAAPGLLPESYIDDQRLHFTRLPKNIFRYP